MALLQLSHTSRDGPSDLKVTTGVGAARPCLGSSQIRSSAPMPSPLSSSSSSSSSDSDSDSHISSPLTALLSVWPAPTPFPARFASRPLFTVCSSVYSFLDMISSVVPAPSSTLTSVASDGSDFMVTKDRLVPATAAPASAAPCRGEKEAPIATASLPPSAAAASISADSPALMQIVLGQSPPLSAFLRSSVSNYLVASTSLFESRSLQSYLLDCYDDSEKAEDTLARMAALRAAGISVSASVLTFRRGDSAALSGVFEKGDDKSKGKIGSGISHSFVLSSIRHA